MKYRARIAPTLWVLPLVSLACGSLYTESASALNPPANLRIGSGSGVDCVHKVWQNLEACGWPGPGNTGWQPTGVTLTLGGSMTITTPGTVIDSRDISGNIYISANNVTIKRSRVRGSAFALIQVKDGISGARIEDCELDGRGTAGGTNSMGVIGPATVLRSNIYGVENGFTPLSGSSLQDSYIHDLGAPGSPHYDNIQIDGGTSNISIIHNTLHNAYQQTSAIMVDDYFGSTANIAITNNLMAGGGFIVYAYAANGNTTTNVTHTNNKFSTALYPCAGYFGVWYPRAAPTDGWHRSGNVILETGQNIDNQNPTVNESVCN